MYADFRSLTSISGIVNLILGVITLILASRTKNNSWNEHFAARLFGWFLIFGGIALFSEFMQNNPLWRGPSTYTLDEFQTIEITATTLFFVMLEKVAISAQVAVVMAIPLFFPYAFLQHENSQRIAAGFILIFTLILAGLSIFYPYEIAIASRTLSALPILIFGFVYLRFIVKELKYGDKSARVISSSAGLLILAISGQWLTDWLLWITIPEKWATPVWIASLGPDLNPQYLFVGYSIMLTCGVAALFLLFIGEAIRLSREGNSPLASLTFGFFVVGIISFIADVSIFDTLQQCVYETCNGLPESWLIYNTFTNTLAGYLVQPLVIMFVLLNYNLIDATQEGNRIYARAMVILIVVIASSTFIEMIQSIIPIGEIITSAVLAIGIAAAIGWEERIMQQFLATKNSTAEYLAQQQEILNLEFSEGSSKTFSVAMGSILIFGFILAVLHSALGLG